MSKLFDDVSCFTANENDICIIANDVINKVNRENGLFSLSLKSVDQSSFVIEATSEDGYASITCRANGGGIDMTDYNVSRNYAGGDAKALIQETIIKISLLARFDYVHDPILKKNVFEFSTEETAVDKLIREETEAKASNSHDLENFELKKEKEGEEYVKENPPDTSSTSSSSDDSSSDDSGGDDFGMGDDFGGMDGEDDENATDGDSDGSGDDPDTTEDATDESSSEDTKDESTEKEATESYDDLIIKDTKYFIKNVSVESYYDDEPISNSQSGDSSDGKIMSAIKGAAGFAVASAKFLYGIGINYIAPGAWKLVKVTASLLRYFATFCAKTNPFAKKQLEVFNSLLKDLESLKQRTNEIKSVTNNSNESGFVNLKRINCLKMSNSTNLIANTKIVEDMVKTSMQVFGIRFTQHSQAIGHLFKNGFKNGVPNVLLMKGELTLSDPFVKTKSADFETPTDKLEVYAYKHGLPGDIILIANIPPINVRGVVFDERVHLYNYSNIFFGYNSKGFKKIDSIPYFDRNNLLKLIGELESLCKICISHERFYTAVKKDSISNFKLMISYFKSYLNDTSGQFSEKELLREIRIKSEFVEKNYLEATVRSHEYAIRYILNCLEFIESNLNNLS